MAVDHALEEMMGMLGMFQIHLYKTKIKSDQKTCYFVRGVIKYHSLLYSFNQQSINTLSCHVYLL